MYEAELNFMKTLSKKFFDKKKYNETYSRLRNKRFDLSQINSHLKSLLKKHSDYFASKYIEVEAQFTLIPFEQGGRENGIASGYRPNNVFEYKKDGSFKEVFLGSITTNHYELIREGKCKLLLLKKDSLLPYLKVGQRWFIHEGSRLVGHGKMTKI